jgi:hypothetical protein
MSSTLCRTAVYSTVKPIMLHMKHQEIIPGHMWMTQVISIESIKCWKVRRPV